MPKRPTPPPAAASPPSSPDADAPAVKRGRGRPRKTSSGDVALPVLSPQDYTIDSPDIQFKLRELIKLAKEQEYLTYDDINEILRQDDVKATMAQQGAVAGSGNAAAFGKFVAGDIERFGKIVRAANIRE